MIRLGKNSAICAVLRDAFNSKTLRDLKNLGVQLVELRADFFKQTDAGELRERIRTLKKHGFSVILTIRHSSEGGFFRGNESERLKLFQALTSFADAVDVELKSPICNQVIRIAKQKKKIAIVSFHDFKKTPSTGVLERYFKLAHLRGASVFKAACFAKSKKDYLRMLDFTIEHPGQVITISMGKIGAPSRVLFPRCGSLITYGSFGAKTAQGQLSVKELLKKLRQ